MIDCDKGSDEDSDQEEEPKSFPKGKGALMTKRGHSVSSKSKKFGAPANDSYGSDQETEEEFDEKELQNDINWASKEIKAAIKYKLVDNLYRNYLGTSVQYNRVINSTGNIHKEKMLDTAQLIRIDKF